MKLLVSAIANDPGERVKLADILIHRASIMTGVPLSYASFRLRTDWGIQVHLV